MMKASKDPTSEYKVGYGKPPKQHQFRKGVSGNPKGRLPKEPPRERMITPRQVHLDFLSVTEQDVKITLNGKEVVLPAIFAIYQRMILKALAGDHRAAVSNGVSNPARGDPRRRGGARAPRSGARSFSQARLRRDACCSHC